MPTDLFYPVAQFIVAGLCAAVLAWVLREHYRDHRHARRMAAARQWQTYQGGSVRAAPETIYSIAGTTPPDDTEDCAS